MTLLRQTLVWFCSTLLVASGFFGQGVVLCIQRGEAARLEVSGNDGRCVGDIQRSSGVQSAGYRQTGLATQPHNHGCKDVELAESVVRSPAWDSDSLKTTPVVVSAGAFPHHKTAGLRDLAPFNRPWPPAHPIRNSPTVRLTAPLLI